ncbi:hypothetical protein MKZ38_001028 [Zalerion maritima]|uniref:Uncharacterized protein n=1 Tax=Zalerion maritima TaxID=339359 RepID=A0AAD5RQS6_9PEZI|nr:hypothetical protein MKZ38_001028 [Zalerion maritima]
MSGTLGGKPLSVLHTLESRSKSPPSGTAQLKGNLQVRCSTRVLIHGWLGTDNRSSPATLLLFDFEIRTLNLKCIQKFKPTLTFRHDDLGRDSGDTEWYLDYFPHSPRKCAKSSDLQFPSSIKTAVLLAHPGRKHNAFSVKIRYDIERWTWEDGFISSQPSPGFVIQPSTKAVNALPSLDYDVGKLAHVDLRNLVASHDSREPAADSARLFTRTRAILHAAGWKPTGGGKGKGLEMSEKGTHPTSKDFLREKKGEDQQLPTTLEKTARALPASRPQRTATSPFRALKVRKWREGLTTLRGRASIAWQEPRWKDAWDYLLNGYTQLPENHGTLCEKM